jgi:hypothetical protein
MNLLLNKTNNIFLLFIFSLFTQESRAQNTVPSPEIQIRLAVLAAPADKRANATVYGFNAPGELVLLRKGSNEMICLADDPLQDGFSVACYHRDLQAFMQRGRELKKSGKTTQEIFDTREKEVKAGKLLMPKDPSTLFVYTASRDNYDAVQGVVNKGYLRYVVYIPYATSESTGLPLKPEGPAMPWIMHPGTHGAHIMINPPKTE